MKNKGENFLRKNMSYPCLCWAASLSREWDWSLQPGRCPAVASAGQNQLPKPRTREYWVCIAFGATAVPLQRALHAPDGRMKSLHIVLLQVCKVLQRQWKSCSNNSSVREFSFVQATDICDKGLGYNEAFLAIFALKKLPFLGYPWKQKVWLG